MTGTLPPLLDSVVGEGTPERSCVRVHMDSMLQCPGKGLVLPNPNIDDISKHARLLILSLPNDEMSRKSPFFVHKALIGIGGEPKSIKKLKSDSPLTVSPHRTLNSFRSVIFEPDLLCASETEILEGLSDQGVTQCPPLELLHNQLHPSRNKIKLHLFLKFQHRLRPIKHTYYLPLLQYRESQPTIPTFNTNDPLYLANQAIVKKSTKRLLPKYNETGTSFLQISKSNIPTKFAAIAVKKISAQKPPLIPRRKKRPPKTISKDIGIKMTPHKPNKSTPIQDTSDEEDMFEEEEMNHRISTPSRNGK
ncbi:uncharacterized protein TNCV_1955871 [Trichonephila clavipes]|nr:uncharacterized protein TNCV_1955871 [Trichonephila clavipes]